MKKEAVAIRYDADSATEYAQRKQRAQLNAHALLTRDEEQTLLGRKISARSVGNMPSAGTLDLPARESKARVIASIEQLLRRMLVSTVAMDRQDFPLTASDVEDNELGRTIFAELSDSWSAHQRMPMFELAREIVQLEKELLVQHSLAKVAREQVEHYLLAHADHVPMNAGWHALGFLMRRAANLEPRVSLRDFARAAWEPTHLRLFNPFLSDAAVDEVLQPAVLEWLQLCVLEDKLQRMALIAADCNAPELERELREVGRDWSVTQHPQWLVFEVEQQLQIRRMQYCVAKYCIDTPGAITQLNMGEGKTRVILPMLVLHLAQPNRLVRLHFLSQLIGEAYFYLHRHLTASIMCRRLLHLPFHRGVKLTVQDVQVVRDCLVRCMRAHGAICISPEHRLSLQLKWHELRLSQVNADLVQALPSLDDLPYCDLLDESDEILHHKYHLIYACGANVQLPDGNVRWTAVQTMLHVLQESPQVATLLAKPHVAKRLPMGAQKGAGAFDGLRLLPGSELDNVRMPLRRELAWALLRGPPYHMRWLRDTSVKRASNDIIKFLTDPNDALGRFMAMLTASSCPINDLQRAQLLALRGLLASGLLEHCLSRRHRVDYGVDPRRGINRRVAVPYRASDTPSDRAEYAQPDTLIILTHLSYYHSGLSRDELKEAVAALLKLGPMAQERHYGQWLESARSNMSASHLSALDNVNKLDVSSDVQLDIMHKVYHYNMSTVNFWLDTCVLPRETMQFPKRLVANAFNLTDNPRRDVIGFSGTKENHLLLPFHVMQGLPKGADELLATDGKMCDLVLQNKDVSILSTTCELSAAVLRLAVVERGADALIDAGATMAGLSNEEVATKVIELLPQSSRLQGAIYFSPQEATWLVRSRHGRTWPQSSSPIHEKDCFVYFDESRCRGADMKLLPNAEAVLTIGPKMGKSKLMQAAGRMRKLDRGQRLLFAVPPELVPKIMERNDVHSLSSLHLLKWVLCNTANAIAAGLPEFSIQASHFCMTKDNPAARLLDENLELADLYGSAFGEERVDDVVKRTIERDIKRCNSLQVQYSTVDGTRQAIESLGRRYGSDLRVLSTGVEEECERELENERELDREVERQMPKHEPVSPTRWNFETILKASRPTELRDAGVMALQDAINAYLDTLLAAIQWAQCSIFVTKAYMVTVADSQGLQLKDQSEYMRPPDAIVVFPNGDVLLLSEWEADEVLPLLWKAAPSSTGPFMVNFAYLRAAADANSPTIQMRVPPPPAPSVPRLTSSTTRPAVSDLTLAGLQLLAGETMFKTEARKTAIKALAASSLAAKKAALLLVQLRGRQHMISFSDLELVCNLMGD